MSRKAIGIIPARWGSTRFPGKPLALISGRSLIERVYRNAALCKSLDHLVVATDDQRIFDHVKQFGGDAVMTSAECETGSDRLAEVIDRYPDYQGYPIVVNIQGDEPCLPLVAIEKVVELLQDDEGAVAATTISMLKPEDAHNTSVVKCVKDLQDNALYFSRALIPGNLKGEFQSSHPYYRHMGLYAYRAEFLPIYKALPATPLQRAENLEQLKILENGFRMKVALVDASGIDVNHPEDVKKVESYLWEQNISS